MSLEARDYARSYDPPHPSRCGELAGAMATESRLVRRLIQSVLDQRDAIASNQVENVESSVFALQRILQTLGQAKVNRRNILEIIGWVDVGLEDLPTVAGESYTAELSAARDELVASVDHLRRELLLNGEILSTVISGGQSFLRALVDAGTDGGGGYPAQDGTQSTQGQALMMNKVI